MGLVADALKDAKRKKTTGQTVCTVNLTMDVRNAIHGLEPWPFDD